jgi:hypothetical protein
VWQEKFGAHGVGLYRTKKRGSKDLRGARITRNTRRSDRDDNVREEKSKPAPSTPEGAAPRQIQEKRQERPGGIVDRTDMGSSSAGPLHGRGELAIKD